MTGKLEWERHVFPDSTWVEVTAIVLGASDGSIAASGSFALGRPWLARHSETGEMLWHHFWPAAPKLALTSEGVLYAAAAVSTGQNASDIHLTALDPDGNVLWEASYDSGPASADTPSVIALAPDGHIWVLGLSGESVVLLNYSPTGSLTSANILGVASPSAHTLVLDQVRTRALAYGEITRGGGCGADADLLVMSYDFAGGSRILGELDQPMDARFSRGIGVHVGPGGRIMAAVETNYLCTTSLDLLSYGPDGSDGWQQVHPSGAQFGFHDSGFTTVGCKRDGFVELERYNPEGEVAWSGRFESFADASLNGLLVTPADEVVLADAATTTQGTVLVAINAGGEERWRRTLEGTFVHSDPVRDPEGRIYVRNASPSPRIDCVSFEGEPQWSRVIDNLGYLYVQEMAAASGGFVYLIGSLDGEWVTLRLRPGGDTDWIATETQASPVRIRVHPGGGVVVAGVVRTDSTSNDALVVRYADDGGVLWRARVATEQNEQASDVALDPAGNIFVVIENSSAGETRTIMYSPQGDVVWDRVFHDGGGRAIAVGPDQSVAVVGTAEGDSAFTLKYDDPFPVEITSFAAQWMGSDVQITWSVASGLDPAGFEMFHAASRDDDYRSLTPVRLPAEARSYWHRDAPPGDAFYMLEVIELDGSRVRLGPVPATLAPLPAALWLAPPSPNPAAGIVEWQLGLPAPGRVRLVVHDVAGRTVATIVDAAMPAGVHRIPWDRRRGNADQAPAGVYFFRLEAGGEVRAGKLVLGPRR